MLLRQQRRSRNRRGHLAAIWPSGGCEFKSRGSVGGQFVAVAGEVGGLVVGRRGFVSRHGIPGVGEGCEGLGSGLLGDVATAPAARGYWWIVGIAGYVGVDVVVAARSTQEGCLV